MSLVPIRKPRSLKRNTVVNPKVSTFAVDMPYNLRVHHVTRALQVTRYFQQQGRFPKYKFDSFYGRGAAVRGFNPTKGSTPPGTRRRSLESMTQEGFLRGGFLPFPGNIQIVTQKSGRLRDAAFETLTLWLNNPFTVKGPGYEKKKNHEFRYHSSLLIYVDGRNVRYGELDSALENATDETIVTFTVAAPHASVVDYRNTVNSRGLTLWNIFRIVRNAFQPEVQIGFGYDPSDAYGYRYGKNSGGPLKGNQVYALPVLFMSVARPGALNATVTRPGVNARKRLRAARHAQRG